MKSEDLKRRLNSVGKAAFVDNFSLLKSCADGQISRQSCIESLVAKGVSNMEGASIRVSNATTIFRADMEYDALTLVLESNRVPSTVVKAARRILDGRVK